MSLKECAQVPPDGAKRRWICIMADGTKRRMLGARLWFDAREEAKLLYGESLDSVVLAPEREQPSGS